MAIQSILVRVLDLILLFVLALFSAIAYYRKSNNPLPFRITFVCLYALAAVIATYCLCFFGNPLADSIVGLIGTLLAVIVTLIWLIANAILLIKASEQPRQQRPAQFYAFEWVCMALLFIAIIHPLTA